MNNIYLTTDTSKPCIIMEWDGKDWKPITKQWPWSFCIKLIKRIREEHPKREPTDYSIRSL